MSRKLEKLKRRNAIKKKKTIRSIKRNNKKNKQNAKRDVKSKIIVESNNISSFDRSAFQIPIEDNISHCSVEGSVLNSGTLDVGFNKTAWSQHK